MFKGFAAMPSLSMILKSGALACATLFAAGSAAADQVTVYVYLKGYFPSKVYTQDVSSIKFINKTQFTLGLDYANGGVMVNDISAGNYANVSLNSLSNRPLKQPYVFAANGYLSGEGFQIVNGAAPNM